MILNWSINLLCIANNVLHVESGIKSTVRIKLKILKLKKKKKKKKNQSHVWLTHQLDLTKKKKKKLTNLKKIVGCKVFHFINNEDQEALGYKNLRCKDVVTSF